MVEYTTNTLKNITQPTAKTHNKHKPIHKQHTPHQQQ
jgi:hypothetical protein